jgi:hypothetical protein
MKRTVLVGLVVGMGLLAILADRSEAGLLRRKGSYCPPPARIYMPAEDPDLKLKGTIQNTSTLVLALKKFVQSKPTLGPADREEILRRLDKIGIPTSETPETPPQNVLGTPFPRLSVEAVQTIPNGTALEELRETLRKFRARTEELEALLGQR